MRWLLHGPTSAAASEALQRHEHTVQFPASIGLADDAAAIDVLQAARKAQLDILTTDPALAAEVFAKDFYLRRSMVLLQDIGDAHADAVDRLFERFKRLSPDRLYTVSQSHVKVRQLPSRPHKTVSGES